VPIYVYKPNFGDGIKVDFVYAYGTPYDSTELTTSVYLVFDREINGLGLDDIYLSGNGTSSIVKERLSVPMFSGGMAYYVLDIGGRFSHNTSLTIAIQKQGVEVTGDKIGDIVTNQKTVTLYSPRVIYFNRLTATAGSPTPSVVLTLSDALNYYDTPLTAANITCTGIPLNNGTLTPSNNGTTFTLQITGLTQGGTLTVTIRKDGYRFDFPLSVNILYSAPAGIDDAVAFEQALAEKYIPGSTNEVTITVAASLSSLTGFKEALEEYRDVKVKLIIPNDSALTGIAAGAFSGSSNLVGITLPTRDEFTSIGNNAFTGAGITEISIPKNITTLAVNSFTGCDKLEEVTLLGGPATVNAAFNAAALATSPAIPALRKVTIGGASSTVSGVTAIGAAAFEGCVNLASVTIGASVTGAIGDTAFKNCKALATINIPATLTGTIGAAAFNGCTGLRTVVLNGGNTSTATPFQPVTANLGETSNIEEVFIGGSVTKILGSSFKNSKNLVSVDIAGTVVDSSDGIGESAFEGCEKLANVSIAEGVTKIGDTAFKNCPALKNITIPETLATFGNTPFALDVTTGTGLQTITLNGGPTTGGVITTFAILNNIETVNIGPNFAGELTAASFAGNLTFPATPALKEFTVDTSNAKYSSDGGVLYEKTTVSSVLTVTKITMYPFKKTGTEFELPATVTTIGDSAFKGAAITKLTIDSSITVAIPTAGNDPFANCAITTLVVNRIPGALAAFNGNLATTVTNLTIGKKDDAATAPTITAASFSGLTGIKNIVFEERVLGTLAITTGTFSSVTAIESVQFKGDKFSMVAASFPSITSPVDPPAYVSLDLAYEQFGVTTYNFSATAGWTKK
jgi:hypothetical protein